MILFACLPLTAVAASLSTVCFDSPTKGVKQCNALLSGEIRSGDNELLLEYLRDWKDTDNQFFGDQLVLDSPGGDVLEAIKIAGTVRKALLTTSNVSWYSAADHDLQFANHICASACFLIWSSGSEKLTASFHDGRRSGLGLHRPYLVGGSYRGVDTGKIANDQQTIMAVTREFLLREGVPDDLIAEMMKRSSRDVLWLSTADAYKIPTRAPWYEEWLIDRCGFDSELNEAVISDIVRAAPEKRQKYFDMKNRCSIEAGKAARAFRRSLRR